MQHPDYPIWSAISLVLVLLPAPWHWKARNIATISLISWLTLANIVLLVNTIVWADNYADYSPVWCDISAYILAAVTYAVPACSLSQMRRLASVTSTRRPTVTPQERKRRMWGEIALCGIFPLLMLPLAYVVQGHRYDIVEHTGCSIPVYFSWLGFVIRTFVPCIICLLSLLYSALAIRGFLISRLQFRSILAKSESNLTVGRYLRLIALAFVDTGILVFGTIVVVVVGLVSNEGYRGLRPYASWAAVHDSYAQISQFPAGLRTPATDIGSVIGFYLAPLYSITFFIFFGFGEEAIKEYVAMGRRLREYLVRTGIFARSSTPLLIPITLGSKVVIAGESGAEEQMGSRGEKFSAAVVATSSGIPVTVERSIV